MGKSAKDRENQSLPATTPAETCPRCGGYEAQLYHRVVTLRTPSHSGWHSWVPGSRGCSSICKPCDDSFHEPVPDTGDDPRPAPVNLDMTCPVCGYYCLGHGGHGCIDKPGFVRMATDHGATLSETSEMLIERGGADTSAETCPRCSDTRKVAKYLVEGGKSIDPVPCPDCRMTTPADRAFEAWWEKARCKFGFSDVYGSNGSVAESAWQAATASAARIAELEKRPPQALVDALRRAEQAEADMDTWRETANQAGEEALRYKRERDVCRARVKELEDKLERCERERDAAWADADTWREKANQAGVHAYQPKAKP